MTQKKNLRKRAIARHRPDPQRAQLWWSALAVECLELWSMRLHILSVTLLAKRITCAQLHYFHKMQNAVPILSQDTQERIVQSRSCDKSFSFDFSFSRSALSVSRALSPASLSLFYSVTLSVQLSLSPLSLSFSPSSLLSFSLFPFISLSHFLSLFSHRVTSSIRLT